MEWLFLALILLGFAAFIGISEFALEKGIAWVIDFVQRLCSRSRSPQPEPQNDNDL